MRPQGKNEESRWEKNRRAKPEGGGPKALSNLKDKVSCQRKIQVTSPKALTHASPILISEQLFAEFASQMALME
jgi:hypothetical protein